mgnify:CR=1 FL=1
MFEIVDNFTQEAVIKVIGVGGAGDRLLSVGDTTSHFAVDLVSGIVVSAR